jgi:hypothetical protein
MLVLIVMGEVKFGLNDRACRLCVSKQAGERLNVVKESRFPEGKMREEYCELE